MYESEDDCVAHGGHCWVGSGIVMASSPPQYPEGCKHCPASRVRIPREPWTYRYPDGRQG